MGSYRRYDDYEILTAQVGDLLSHIPGIAYWLQVASHPLISLDDILDKALEAHANALVGKTFCVRCNVSVQTRGRLPLSVEIGLQRIGPEFLFPNSRYQVPDIPGWVKADA